MCSRKLACGIAVLGSLFAAIACGQSNRPSPPATADITLKGQQVSIAYSRPSLRGRKLGTDLAPYNQVWRTGANEATTLTTPVDLNIGGTNVPAGKYTLWTLPSEGAWKLIINKQTGQWGTDYDQSQDLARVNMQNSKTSQPVEQFTISWQSKGADSADLILEWATTRASVRVTTK